MPFATCLWLSGGQGDQKAAQGEAKRRPGKTVKNENEPHRGDIGFFNPKFTRAFIAHRKDLRGGTDSTLTISGDRSREPF